MPDEGFELKAGPVLAWVQVASYIESLINAGTLPHDARLRGERDLAEEYGVSVGTIRRAILELQRDGKVITIPSKGTFVVNPQ